MLSRINVLQQPGPTLQTHVRNAPCPGMPMRIWSVRHHRTQTTVLDSDLVHASRPVQPATHLQREACGMHSQPWLTVSYILSEIPIHYQLTVRQLLMSRSRRMNYRGLKASQEVTSSSLHEAQTACTSPSLKKVSTATVRGLDAFRYGNWWLGYYTKLAIQEPWFMEIYEGRASMQGVCKVIGWYNASALAALLNIRLQYRFSDLALV
jgi:hypothetical protein